MLPNGDGGTLRRRIVHTPRTRAGGKRKEKK